MKKNITFILFFVVIEPIPPKKISYIIDWISNMTSKVLEDNGFIESKRNEEWTIAWSSGHIKLSNYQKLNKYHKMNHFPRSNELTRKDLLYKNLSKLKESFPGTKFDFLPESHILPNEFTFLKDKMDKNPNQVWIVKPVASSQCQRDFFKKKYI